MTPSITVYCCSTGLVAQRAGDWFTLAEPHLDELFQQRDPAHWLAAAEKATKEATAAAENKKY